ncbi:MAG TPA: hypothetical protein VJ777_19470 [Mycobacterium sp.]|nr:hypothetical protein [Mycobacterium sp.]
MNAALKLALFALLLVAMVAGGAVVGAAARSDEPEPAHVHTSR